MDSEEREGREEKEAVGAYLEHLASVAIDAGLKVHRSLGPGLLESAYEQCLAHELALRGLSVNRQVAMAVTYEGITLDAAYRIDLLVAEQLIIEIKSVDAVSRLHEAQLRTYLRLSSRPFGLLMNFNVALFKEGLQRIEI